LVSIDESECRTMQCAMAAVGNDQSLDTSGIINCTTHL
jgi:hypothetical protein